MSGTGVFPELVCDGAGGATAPRFKPDQLVVFESYDGRAYLVGRVGALLIAHQEGFVRWQERLATGVQPGDEWGYAIECIDGNGYHRVAWDMRRLCDVEQTEADYASYERKLAREEATAGYGR